MTAGAYVATAILPSVVFLLGCTPSESAPAVGERCFARGPLQLTLSTWPDPVAGRDAGRITWILDSPEYQGDQEKARGEKDGGTLVEDRPLVLLAENVSCCDLLLDKNLILAACSFGLTITDVREYDQLSEREIKSMPASQLESTLRVVPRVPPSNPPVGEVLKLRPGEVVGIQFTLREDAGLAKGVELDQGPYWVQCRYEMRREGRWWFYKRTCPEMWAGIAESNSLVLSRTSSLESAENGRD